MSVKNRPAFSRVFPGIPGYFGLFLFISLVFSSRAEIVLQSSPPKTNETGIIVPPPGSEEVGKSDVLEFLNGDVLHGTFLSIDPRRGARWQHIGIKQPLEISLASLARIKLDRPKSTNASANSPKNCSVRLLNRDELIGELVQLDSEKLQLQTWYGGTLNIPRKSIDMISPGNGKSSLVYEGPAGLEGWNMPRSNPGNRRPAGQGAWKYSNGKFISTGPGPIGREFLFPPLVNIEFDLQWRIPYLQVAVSLFSDNLETYGGNAYLLQINQGSVYLQRISRTGDSSGFGSTEIQNLARKNQARFSIRVNKEQKSISLLVDGALVKQWADRGDFPPGSNLVFHQQAQGVTTISNIRIEAWDGKFDTPGSTSGSKEDLVKLTNNDKISGTLKTIQNGTMHFQTAFATMEVPVERIAEIELAGEKPQPPAPSGSEVKLAFADRGSVTFQIERWDDQQVTGSSPNLGKVKFNPLAFNSVQFNLDKKRVEAEPFDGGGGADGLIIDFE